MAINYTALKAELQTDPNAYGYAAMIAAGQMQTIADALNLSRVGISVPRPDVLPQELLEAIKVTDFVPVNNARYHPMLGSYFESITQISPVRILKNNGTDTRVMTNIMTILTDGSASEARVRALAARQGSRAEQLFGPGTSVSWEDVHKALNNTP